MVKFKLSNKNILLIEIINPNDLVFFKYKLTINQQQSFV